MLKPELITDERTAALSNGAFRLFVSMILLSDDYGNVRAWPEYLRKTIFWALPRGQLRNLRIDELFDELIRARLIESYTVRGQTYAHITNWAKHQRIDRPHKPEVPDRSHIGDTNDNHTTTTRQPHDSHTAATRMQSASTETLSCNENCPSEMKGNEMKDPDPDPDHAGAWEQRDPAPARDPVPSPVAPPPEPEASRPPESELEADGLPPLTWTPETPPPEYLAMLARLGQGGKP